MAEQPPVASDEPGARIPKDAIDPELVKLARSRPAIGVLTALGVVFLCLFFLVKLNPDRRFAGEPEAPKRATVADIAKGNVAIDSHIVVEAEPLMSHAIRTAVERGNIGMRVVPVRGASEKLWLVMPGDGWSDANTMGYRGRLRPLGDLPFADSIRTFLAANPRPLFATAAAVRAGFATNKIVTAGGDEITVADAVRVGFDVVDTNSATVVCTLNDKHKTTAECSKALTDAGLALTGKPAESRQQVRFTVTAPDAVAATKAKLLTANLLGGTAVESVTNHHETTWGQLKTSGPGGFTIAQTTVPEAQLDLVGLYVTRTLPSGAYALIIGEKPQDYWYVLPVTILVGLIALLFAWALVRAVKRDLLPTRA